jgi:hypothetical protein
VHLLLTPEADSSLSRLMQARFGKVDFAHQLLKVSTIFLPARGISSSIRCAPDSLPIRPTTAGRATAIMSGCGRIH